MRVCLMVEGQEGVTWEQWLALAQACERAGLEALFRSDHYLSVQDQPRRPSLDAWATLAALAAATERIRLGTLVSPATFRHPSVLAKMVTTVDHISGGRIELGIGAGWHEPEHSAYGFPFPPEPTRLEMLEEQIEIVHRSWAEETVDFSGRHYKLEALDAQPKPVQEPHPNLIVGGKAGRRSVALAARWADEYNTIFVSPDECRSRRARVAEACKREGRDPDSLVFSLMTGCVVGTDGEEVDQRIERAMRRRGGPSDRDDWLNQVPDNWLLGTVDEAVDQLRALEDAGVQRVMLQMQDHEDVAMVDVMGQIAAKVS